ncbi:MAG: transporter substrate-binding domain-containing protein [Oscillospiraceae bacterium]|nr:transporter substrate-binding domain-containing protein [Oscillospiraceae bacterium]
MNNLRRTLSLLLALVMLVALGAFASAEGNTEAEEAAVTLTDEDVAALSYLNGQLRVGMECAYAPNNWQESEASETNVPIENVPGAYAEGYDVQIARIIADQLGLELVVVKMDWDGLIEALNQGQIDAIIAGMADTESRKEAINFTAPYHETVYALMVNAGTKYEDATSLADFNGASVLGQKDTALDWTIDQIEGVNHLTAVASVPDMIARLQQGTCDAIVINLENAPGYLAANPDFVVISFPEGEGLDPGFKGACVGLRKSDDALLGLADAVLATIDQKQRDELWETALNNQPA